MNNVPPGPNPFRECSLQRPPQLGRVGAGPLYPALVPEHRSPYGEPDSGQRTPSEPTAPIVHERRLLMRMLGSGHWTGDLMLRLEAVLTSFGGLSIFFGGWLLGLSLFFAAGIVGAGLSWLYLRAEAAGDTWDPADYGGQPLRWTDLREVPPWRLAVGVVGLLLVIAIAIGTTRLSST